MEDGQPGDGIKTRETRHIARRMQNGGKSIIKSIPWRGGGMDVIDAKAYQIDHKEGNGEAEIDRISTTEIETQRKGQGHWHPAQIEESSHDIGHGMMVLGKPGARDNRLASGQG